MVSLSTCSPPAQLWTSVCLLWCVCILFWGHLANGGNVKRLQPTSGGGNAIKWTWSAVGWVNLNQMRSPSHSPGIITAFYVVSRNHQTVYHSSDVRQGLSGCIGCHSHADERGKMWQEEHFGSGGGMLNAVVLPLFSSRTVLGSFHRGYITRNIWNKSMFSSRTGGRRKYFHRFQYRHHTCSQHRHLIAVHLLGCLCWYGEISLFTAPGNLKDTEAASRWQPHCVFLQTSSVFCLLGMLLAGEDESAAGATPLLMTSSLFVKEQRPNLRKDDVTRTHAVDVFLYLWDSEARNRNSACSRVFTEMRTFWMISQRSSRGSRLDLGQVKSQTCSVCSETIFSVFSRWNKREQESLKKVAKVLPVWRTNWETPEPGSKFSLFWNNLRESCPCKIIRPKDVCTHI